MMQEYDDDFFFEEDKIKPLDSKSDSKLLVDVEQSASKSQEKDITDIKNIEEQENGVADGVETNCIFNEMRTERFLIHHQDLIFAIQELEHR